MSTVEHPVTYHAVVRYLERVRGVDLTTRYPGATDRTRVQHAAAAQGVTVDALRAMAVSPRMQAALRLGGDGEIRVGRVRMPVVDGRVLTVIAMPPKATRRRPKIRETGE